MKILHNYQFSLFSINIKDKLTQLGATMSNPEKHLIRIGPIPESKNRGLEMSIGYSYKLSALCFKDSAFLNYTYNDFKYTDFSTYLKEDKQPAK
ncbi:TonB-dependent receptor [Chryseobacterium arthrosphaerae]|uniref:TonB-dependent receptor n=1 Tax=Chryseobacterium arthrosphaerae TaxID=651561 RepID=A0A432DY12_9FLAO|nr:TonB-dependent receptor [Chryseobacterium arthrosphaerae]